MRVNLKAACLATLAVLIFLAGAARPERAQAVGATGPHGTKKLKVKIKSREQRLSELNDFQMDCLSLFRESDSSVEYVETVEGSGHITTAIRVRGTLRGDWPIEFGSDEILYRTKLDQPADTLNFGLRSSKITPDAEGHFSFMIPLVHGQTAQLRLRFPKALDPFYKLTLSLDNGGLLTRAELDAEPDLDAAAKLCPRSRLSASIGAAALTFKQDFSALDSGVSYSTLAAPVLKLTYNRSASATLEHVAQIRVVQAKLKTSEAFADDTPIQEIQFQYLFQKRLPSAVQGFGSSTLHPHLRYGLGLSQLPVGRLNFADQFDLEKPLDVDAVAGLGATLFLGRRWMAELNLDLGYSLYVQTPLKRHFSLAANGLVSYAVTRTVFVGLDAGIQRRSAAYDHSEALDKNGTLDFNFLSTSLQAGVLF